MFPVIDSTNGADKQTIVEVGNNSSDDGKIEGEDVGELQAIKETSRNYNCDKVDRREEGGGRKERGEGETAK